MKPKEQPLPIKVNEKKPVNVSTEEWDFVNTIWNELKAYFDRYDIGSKGYLNHSDLERFVVEVLHETTQRELDYVFWNLFRLDPNGDKQI